MKRLISVHCIKHVHGGKREMLRWGLHLISVTCYGHICYVSYPAPCHLTPLSAHETHITWKLLVEHRTWFSSFHKPYRVSPPCKECCMHPCPSWLPLDYKFAIQGHKQPHKFQSISILKEGCRSQFRNLGGLSQCVQPPEPQEPHREPL